MRLKYGWLIMLVVVALLAAACGPQEDVQTLSDQATAEQSADAAAGKPTAAIADPTQETATEAAPSGAEASSTETASSAELPIDEGDWHVLGSPDAPITMVEYSDFQ